MSNINPEHFEDQVYNASKAAFSRLINANLKQNFYAFGLWTDDSLQFLTPAANTEEGLTATVQHYRKTVDPKYGGTSTRAGLRWSYGDWRFFPNDRGNYFDDINTALSSNFDRIVANEEFESELEPLWKAIQNGFRRLESEKFFGTGSARSKITLLLVGDLPSELTDAWLSVLNPPDVVNRYMNWNHDAPDDGD